MSAGSAACRDLGLPFHLDGARAWNALRATGEDWTRYGRRFDSVSLCLSKGLGTPAGSVLLGSKAFIAEAHRARKVMGGGMRQVGILAAAGLYALDHHFDRLEEDHRRARAIGEVLESHSAVAEVASVDTNIVIFTLATATSDKVVQGFSQMGIACFAFGPDKVRLVTHLDMTTRDVQEACDRIAQWRA